MTSCTRCHNLEMLRTEVRQHLAVLDVITPELVHAHPAKAFHVLEVERNRLHREVFEGYAREMEAAEKKGGSHE